MQKMSKVQKLTLAGVFVAVAVVGSLFSFPVFGSKCAPVQHLINILCAVILGPWYGVVCAFLSSLIRNMLGMGTPMAFTSMIGALLSGIVFWKSRSVTATLFAEMFGSGVLGGLAAYPVATLLMGVAASSVAFYGYIIPFLISTIGGAVLAAVLLGALRKTGVVRIESRDSVKASQQKTV